MNGGYPVSAAKREPPIAALSRADQVMSERPVITPIARATAARQGEVRQEISRHNPPTGRGLRPILRQPVDAR